MFKVGDKVRRKTGARHDFGWHHGDKIFTVSSVSEPERVTITFLELGDDCFWFANNFDLVADALPSFVNVIPPRKETKQLKRNISIVPPSITQPDIRISAFSETNVSLAMATRFSIFDIKALRDTAKAFNVIADILEENSKDDLSSGST